MIFPTYVLFQMAPLDEAFDLIFEVIAIRGVMVMVAVEVLDVESKIFLKLEESLNSKWATKYKNLQEEEWALRRSS